jgi:hypothetical protein
MLARAQATTPGASSDPATAGPIGHGRGALLFLRYLDVVLVITSAPFVLLAGMPRLGYAIGAGGWIAIRFASEFLKRRAFAARDTRTRAALMLAAILGRVWLIALLVLAARFAGGNAAGIMAAVVVLAAFTVELAMSFVLRGPSAAAAGAGR